MLGDRPARDSELSGGDLTQWRPRGCNPRGGPVRAGAELQDADGGVVGAVTSGCFGPTVGGPVAMGYVSVELSKPGTELGAVVRGKTVPVRVARAPS